MTSVIVLLGFFMLMYLLPVNVNSVLVQPVSSPLPVSFTVSVGTEMVQVTPLRRTLASSS